MKYLKILYRLLVYLTSFFTICSRDIKKAEKIAPKMTSLKINWSFSEFFFS